MRIIYTIVLLALAMNCNASTVFNASVTSDQIKSTSELGIINVEGLGEVSLVAHKTGNQLVIFAEDANGKVIGKAETVVGMKETPINVLSADGLKKIIIFWGINTH
jgi:hypothetical protein